MLEDGKYKAKALASASVGFFTRAMIFFAFSAAVGYKIGISSSEVTWNDDQVSGKSCL